MHGSISCVILKSEHRKLETVLSEQSPAVLGEMNQYGTYTWVSTDKIITEIDPFFIVAYGYQDQTGPDGEKHLIWLTLSGATQSLTKTYAKQSDAFDLLKRIREAKRTH